MTLHYTSTSGTSWVLTVAFLQQLKMEALIPAPADCGMWSRMKFLNVQSIALIKIHHQLCQVHGPNNLQQVDMCMMRTAVRGHPSLRMTLWSLCSNALWKNIASQLWNSAVISRSLLHKIVMEHILSRKLCARWVPEQLTLEHKAKRKESAMTFLQWYHDDGNLRLQNVNIRLQLQIQSDD